MRKLIKYSFKWLSIAYKTYNWVVQRSHFLESWVLPQVPDEAKTCAWSILQFAWIRNRTLDIQISNFLLGQRSFDKLNCRKVWICQKNKLKLFRLLSTYIQYAKFWKFFVKLIVAYPQYHLIRTTVNFLVVMVLIFSQNFSSNGPYVVVNFCNFSDIETVLEFLNNTDFLNWKSEFLSILSKYVVVIWAISFQKKTGWSLIYQLLLGPYFLKVYYYWSLFFRKCTTWSL